MVIQSVSATLIARGRTSKRAGNLHFLIEMQKKVNHPISRMCKVLRGSKSGFNGWPDRASWARADVMLSEKIARIHTDSPQRPTTLLRGFTLSLRTLGVRCSRKRAWRG